MVYFDQKEMGSQNDGIRADMYGNLIIEPYLPEVMATPMVYSSILPLFTLQVVFSRRVSSTI